MANVSHLIDGRHDDGGSTRVPVRDPATGDLRGEVPLADGAVVDRAVMAARRAWPAWRDTSLSRRQHVLFRYRDLLERRVDDLARIIVAENGKTLDDARGELRRGIEVVEFACGLPHLLKGEVSLEVSSGVDTTTSRYPLGVCVGITPFNFPAMVPLWMFPMAIACGNTFVLKPSEQDPSTSLRLAELFQEAGLPEGVLSVLHGDADAATRLVTHPDTAAVSFVGSTPVARRIYEMGARAGKRVQALGSAKNHLVVLPDADLTAVADATVSAAFGSAGQRCMAISVLVAVGSVGEELVQMLRTRAAGLRIGPGDDPRSDMGPLISRAHRDRVASYIAEAEVEGASLILDGRELSPENNDAGGYFLGPTILDHVAPAMSVYREEVFGPVLSVVRAETLEEAIGLINDNPYGNGASIYSRSGSAARRFERSVQIGMVGVNVPIPVPVASHSFGGWRSSIFGAHQVYGPASIDFYTRAQVVVSRWPEGDAEPGIDMSFPAGQ